MTASLSDIRSMIIDLDGVLWRGKTPLPGVPEFFMLLDRLGIRWLLASNNSTARPEAVLRRLADLGVQADEGQVLTSALATARYLRRTMPDARRVLVIGEDGIRHALEAAGFSLTDEAAQAEAVVVGLDRSVTYNRLAEATLAIRNGASFIGTNPDRTFPTERGLVPGNGALLAILETASDVQPIVVGKPEPIYFQLALEMVAGHPETTLVLGDRLDTDILGGQSAGLLTCLVLTGVTDQPALEQSELRPNWVFPGLIDLASALSEAHPG
jgi:HAD superfamily hydrolase (TIGR01457 family)